MNIKGITGIKNIIGTQKTKRINQNKGVKRKDEAVISDEAKRRVEFEKYKGIVNKVGEVRSDKVNAAKAKVAAGNLVSNKALEIVAERIAEKFLGMGDKILESLGDEEK